MVFKGKTPEKNNKIKLTVLSCLDEKRSQISKNIHFIVKAWKQYLLQL